MSALFFSLALSNLALAAPRTPACEIFAEADAWNWPVQSTCGKLLSLPSHHNKAHLSSSPETTPEGEDAEPACPLSCRLLDPSPQPVVDADDAHAEHTLQPCGASAELCITPRANPAHTKTDIDLSLFRKPDQEETAPPTPPPPSSHKHGLTHVFDWVKALHTCRTLTAAAIPRSEKPRKNEFESSSTFARRQGAYTACQDEREVEVIMRQARIEPILEEATFYAILRADNIGDYDADVGCFFPGVTARVELDDFKSKDAVYLNHYAAADAAAPINDPKRRLIPRDTELRVELTSGTIASVTLDPDSERTVLLLTSHPVCVDAAMGREYREQSEINGISDYGMQAEVTLKFRFEISPNPADPREMVAWPIWVVDGDFVYRNDPEGTVLKVEPGRKAPVDTEANNNGINFRGSDDGCATVSGGAGLPAVMLGMLGLVGLRRRD